MAQLTTREQFAIMALQGILSGRQGTTYNPHEQDPASSACREAIYLADTLELELRKSKWELWIKNRRLEKNGDKITAHFQFYNGQSITLSGEVHRDVDNHKGGVTGKYSIEGKEYRCDIAAVGLKVDKVISYIGDEMLFRMAELATKEAGYYEK